MMAIARHLSELAPKNQTYGPQNGINITHMLHVWYIYIQNLVIFRVNVGKYSSTMDPMG